MMRDWAVCAVMMLASVASAAGQMRGAWQATDSAARSVTGDVGFSDTKISIHFLSYPIAQIRALTAEEMGAQFDADSTAGGTGALYRVSIPAAQKFLNHNTLCGSENTQWIVTYTVGRSLRLAFYSGSTVPVFTVAAMENANNLCGVYSYAR